MAQFDIYLNRDRNTRHRYPYLMDFQSEAVSLLPTRLTVPLRRKGEWNADIISKLHILLTVHGEECIAFVSEMAAIPFTRFGALVCNAEEYRTELIGASDLLITGF